MKKLLIILFTSFIFIGYAQLGAGSDSQKKNILPFPTTANAYALDKVGKLPIDLFKGKANISIPIYNIKTENLNIPISISYNTGGIKLNELAGIVGLGWALNIPSNVTQNIFDKDDKYFSPYTKDVNVAYQNIRDVGVYDNDIRPYIEGLYSGIYDTKPDIFNFNLPNINGSFIVNNGIGYTIPHDDIKVETYDDIKKIKIIDKEGNKFYLTPKNIITSYSGETGSVTSSESLYSVDSIRTVSNKKITFLYNKTLSYSEKSINERANFLITQKPILGLFETSFPLPPYERYEGSNSNTEWLLTKIIFPDGEISLQYSDDNNLKTTDSDIYRKDLNSVNGVALKKIVITNLAGNIVKDITFNYSYFESASINKSYQDYRLKLTEVKDNLQNNRYSFTYDESSPIPARNSNNDDYWGYINNLYNLETDSNLPQKIYTDYTSQEISVPNGRNRNTNPIYSQLGTLVKIEYPTKGSKKLYYESNRTYMTNTSYTDNYSESVASVINKYPTDGSIDSNTNVDTYVDIPPALLAGKENPRLKIAFGNSCQNNNDNINQIHETSCFGTAKYRGNSYGSNGVPKEFVIPSPTAEPIRVMLDRIGNCRCSYTVSLLSRKYNNTEVEIPLGGLRIKKVEDVNENNTTNIFNYSYKYFDNLSNIYKDSGILNQPFQYTSLRKHHLRRMDEYGNEVVGEPYIEKYLVVSNSSGSYNSYGTSDIVTYSQVTESNDLGSTINIFTQNRATHRLYSHVYSDYNNWKSGLLKKNVVLNNLNDTLRIQDYKYEIKPLKNILSGYLPLNMKDISFAFDLDIIKYYKQISPSMTIEAELYDVNKEYIAIESGKIENVEISDKEFLGNKIIEKVNNYNYSDTDINKPINLISEKTASPDHTITESSYQYAHEKNNQLMIDRNMVGIPLETTTTQIIGGTTKTLSKTETIYPTSLPTAQTGNLVLPTSVLSYDLQNPASSTTEVTYDKYDSKGNIQQYTTKDGISTAIIWGYNNTQPIAKVVGATYAQVSNLATGIISASDTDASAVPNNDETAILTALDNFRKDSSMTGYQVTTYTYDPLIGVRSITPPSGIREVYLYDTANRLKEIREQNQTGKLLKEFKYNYKN
ncbi:hypothetical protein [Chryseobacterium taichungense]|uniref:hypothetical protein n=1 Tax=Chryseobacterium taichungense TaxID=295069 RepID=UPI0028B260C6|nr:hypothetical protein [Chryseobacterium taichungense]